MKAAQLPLDEATRAEARTIAALAAALIRARAARVGLSRLAKKAA